MLVLTRKPDQSIIIGSDIEITVLEVRGEQVRLGIRAPRSVAVHRKEVFEQINSENDAQESNSIEHADANVGKIEMLKSPPELVET